MSDTNGNDNGKLLVLHVQVQVKPESVAAFRQATIANARSSAAEPGVARFDFLQSADDPTRFALIEVYRSPEGHAAHRETAHYQRWREIVEPMMAATRVPTKYVNVFPADSGW